MSHRLELWDDSNLEEYVKEFTWQQEIFHKPQEQSHAPICDKCIWKMVMREAHRWSHKWEYFYGCSNYPKCKNIIKST